MDEFEDAVRPRRYVEAYPRIAVVAAHKALERGRPGVLWRDQHGDVIGGGFVGRPTEDVLVLKYGLYETRRTPSHNATLAFNIKYMAAGTHRIEPYALCPSCHKICKQLVFFDLQWLCAPCQGLKNRSSVVGPVVRWSEQLEKLEKRIGAGRPKHMQEHTYRALVAHRNELARKLHDRSRSANASYSAMITAEWMVEWYADDLPGGTGTGADIGTARAG